MGPWCRPSNAAPNNGEMFPPSNCYAETAAIIAASLSGINDNRDHMTQHVRETLVAANEIDAELEQSLTTIWDAKVYSWDNSKYPFNEWILGRIRGMGYKLDDLSYLHEAVPLNEIYKVTKQLCADTNLPEFRRMLNRFVREQVVTKASCGFRSRCSGS